MSGPEVRIYDIMACDVYWDFEGNHLPKEQHKFLVSFYPTPGVPTPELIDSIVAKGPDGYEVTFTNQLFTPRNTDGFIYDRTLDYYWYMVNLPTGFLKEGEYTIEVRSVDGKVETRSCHQKSDTAKALVEHYTAHREQILSGFAPAGRKTLDAVPGEGELTCEWPTLNQSGGPDAYYIYRLSTGASVQEFDTQNLTWWDNIFIQRMRGEAQAGLNRGSVTAAAALKPGTDYGYFVEVTDANAQGETNICIFQPHQYFSTPA
ncbi:hypothetical protein [Nocardiopsis sp. LOL_012]|uniref:hypothetical protein n=1 Tax=Nocardiopsis sp. LOL_012 TaxID=3345409 RepID=UPI003A8AB940